MLSELFDRILSVGRELAAPTVTTPPGEPSHVYYLDGKPVEAEPKPRDHVARDLTALVEFAVNYDLPDKPDTHVELWYSHKGVVCLLDHSTRRDLVRLPLAETSQLTHLRLLASGTTWYDQKGFVKMLRLTLAGCCPQSLIDTVRVVKFKVNEQGESEVRHGRASIGRSLEAELTGAGTIPEEVHLIVPVFEGGDLADAKMVQCLIDIDAQNAKLSLTPLPGEIEHAVRSAEGDVGRRLRELLADRRAAEAAGGGEAGSPAWVETVQVLYGIP